MKIEKPRTTLTFHSGSSSEDGLLRVKFDTKGEPYRDGVTIELERPDLQQTVGVFLTSVEGRTMRDLLNRLFPSQFDMSAPDGLLTTVADKIAAGEVVDTTKSAGVTAQYVRELASAAGLKDAYVGSQEEVAIWKARALAAEAELRELPTIEMVLLQAQKYASATTEEDRTHELGDLRNMIINLSSDSK